MDGDTQPQSQSPEPWPVQSLAQLDRAARVEELADRIRRCLVELDDLGLWKAGAFLDQAVHELESRR